MTNTFRLALWATNLGPPFSGLDTWLAHVGTRATYAAAQGAQLLVMPEYACEAWLGFKPVGLRPEQEIAWLASVATNAQPRLREISAEVGLPLLPGTMPWAVDDGFRNRAWLMAPDGRLTAQDKLCLTPFERDSQSWLLAPGDVLQVVELNGLRLAVLVCLDVELPALSCRIAEADLDLLLVPSMTASTAGHARVFGCAKARAIELMCAVACTGVVGVSPGTTQNDSNVSGNAVYLPCEPALGDGGVLIETPVTGGLGGEEPFDVVDIPIGIVRRLRASGSEVWPGNWSASHLQLSFEWQS